MEKQATVKELRELGYKVGVRYERYPAGEGEVVAYSPRNGFLLVQEGHVDVDPSKGEAHPRGGHVQVDVIAPDGCAFVGHSYCSVKDNFNRKLGLTIALGRALKEEELKHAL